MFFSPLTPDSPYYFRPLFPEVEDIEEAPPIDETISAPQPDPQPEPPVKNIKKKKKKDHVGEDIDRVRTKSLLPLVTPERKKNDGKYSDGFYEKRAANWQKKWEERKVLVIDKEEQRRINFRNKLEHYGITFPDTPQTH